MNNKRRVRKAFGRILTAIGGGHIFERPLKDPEGGAEAFDLAGVDSDTSYAIFEAYFRGGSEAVASRQERYLPWLSRAFTETRLPILDVGCGRGETLMLCREHNIVARGVDINELFVHTLAERGFDVTLSDALAYLDSLEPASLGGIVVNSVIEHLSPEGARRLIESGTRAIAPGGCFVLETNNAESPYAMGRFWLDPTHTRPYHAQTLTFWLTGFGFKDVVTQYRTLVPWRHRRLFGRAVNYQEYIVVGYKPKTAGTTSAV